MLHTPETDDDNILERLRHPEREAERHRVNKNLYLRNILNSLFILLALIAMIGIGVTTFGQIGGSTTMWWYGLGLFAVLLKMVEVVLRMPGMRK